MKKSILLISLALLLVISLMVFGCPPPRPLTEKEPVQLPSAEEPAEEPVEEPVEPVLTMTAEEILSTWRELPRADIVRDYYGREIIITEMRVRWASWLPPKRCDKTLEILAAPLVWRGVNIRVKFCEKERERIKKEIGIGDIIEVRGTVYRWDWMKIPEPLILVNAKLLVEVEKEGAP